MNDNPPKGHPYGANIRCHPSEAWPANATTSSGEARAQTEYFRGVGDVEPAAQEYAPATSVLLEANGLVNGERQDDYGPPKEDFGRTARLASIALEKKLREPLDAGDVALFMVCVKLSREVHRHKRDNCVDGAGYFGCLDRVRS